MTSYAASNQIPLNALPTESGKIQQFIANGTNTGTSTFSPDNLAAAPIFGLGGKELQGNEIVSGGVITLISYVGSLLNGGSLCWVLLDSTGGAQQVAPAVAALQAPQFSQLTGVVGTARSTRMLVSTTSTTATISADEIIVETAIGGLQYKLSNFSKVINLATIGAGGMDSGAAPTSGYVALYAIFNPSSAISSTLAVNSTSSVAGNVYTGASLPAGYTASALLGVWPTNSTGQFVIGVINDRHFAGLKTPVMTASTVSQTTLTSLSIAVAAPPNAKRVIGYTEFTANVPANLSMSVAATSSGIAQAKTYGVITSQGQLIDYPFTLELVEPQTLYYTSSVSSGTPSYSIVLTSYEI